MILRTDLDVTNSRLLVHQLVRTVLLVIGSQAGYNKVGISLPPRKTILIYSQNPRNNRFKVIVFLLALAKSLCEIAAGLHA